MNNDTKTMANFVTISDWIPLADAYAIHPDLEAAPLKVESICNKKDATAAAPGNSSIIGDIIPLVIVGVPLLFICRVISFICLLLNN